MKKESIIPMTPENIEILTPESSLIKTISYEKELQKLIVVFKSNDSIYEYYEITPDIFNEIKESESKGSYFLKNIKSKFDYIKL